MVAWLRVSFKYYSSTKSNRSMDGSLHFAWRSRIDRRFPPETYFLFAPLAVFLACRLACGDVPPLRQAVDVRPREDLTLPLLAPLSSLFLRPNWYNIMDPS